MMNDTAPDPLNPGPNNPAAINPLDALRQSVAELTDDDLTLATVVDRLGHHAIGTLLLALTIPAMIPMPGVPAGMVVGVIICLVAAQIMIGGGRLWLPSWLGRRRVAHATITRALDLATPGLTRVGRWLTPGRAPTLTRSATPRALSPLIFLMGLLIALPIPFGNVVPGLSLMALSLGFITRDGGAIAAGLGLGGLGLLACALLGVVTWWVAEWYLAGQEVHFLGFAFAVG